LKRPDIFSGEGLYTAVAQNPKRVGTNAWHSFNLIQQTEGLRFEDFVAVGGGLLDLKWDTERNFVSVKRATRTTPSRGECSSAEPNGKIFDSSKC
jgi:hypothetical protein